MVSNMVEVRDAGGQLSEKKIVDALGNMQGTGTCGFTSGG